MVIGLITARGGSTRTPRKNLAEVCGHPLVAWSIVQSICSHMIDDTYLTTDDDEIAAIGLRYGAKVLRRPSMDHGVTAGVPFLDALKQVGASGVKVDTIVSLLPTSPIRQPDELDRLIKAYYRNGGFVTTACPQKETFIYKLLSPFQDRFSTNDKKREFKATQEHGDKFWNYAKMGGGACAGSRDDFYDAWSSNPEKDIDIDTRPINKLIVHTFVPVEDWGLYDVDYPEDLEMVRVLMERFLINGTGLKIYEEYAKGKA